MRIQSLGVELPCATHLGLGVATVKMWPAKEVVIPDDVARVMADPPEDVTSTTGTPLMAGSRCSAPACEQNQGRGLTSDSGENLRCRGTEHGCGIRKERGCCYQSES